MTEKTKKLVRALFKEMYIHLVENQKDHKEYTVKTYKDGTYIINVTMKKKNEPQKRKTQRSGTKVSSSNS